MSVINKMLITATSLLSLPALAVQSPKPEEIKEEPILTPPKPKLTARQYFGNSVNLTSAWYDGVDKLCEKPAHLILK